MPLKNELAYFEAHRAEFLQAHRGKFALIKGEESHGFFDTDRAAYEEGVGLFGGEAFLIKLVAEEDRIEKAPALFCGLLNASP